MIMIYGKYHGVRPTLIFSAYPCYECTEYRLPEKSEFMDYALYPVNGGKSYFERLNYFFGWRFIIMMAVMYSCVKGLLYSMSNQVDSPSRCRTSFVIAVSHIPKFVAL